MLANMERIHKDVNTLIEVGVGNSQRFINITKLYENLRPQLSAALSGFHAFTSIVGCDFNPAFFAKKFTNIHEVNKARVANFVKTYKILDNDDVFRLPTKSIGASAMSPCQTELRQHFLKTCYIAHLWSHSYCIHPSPFDPDDYDIATAMGQK
ncbi:hypothetical protein PV327_010074 [Microctonus hyperodae]|uniref:Uncharacterized protein n=1 Tax=Microctonus hyperodae TaxID=165561 RepID=A0AA39KGF8_MICHY|nr:hypothetical protein PV327_010074 [Microctonus hyperodae]